MSDEEDEDDIILVPPSPSRHQSTSSLPGSPSRASQSVSQRTLSNFITSQSRPGIRRLSTNQSAASTSLHPPGFESANHRQDNVGPPLPVLNIDEDTRTGFEEDGRVVRVEREESAEGDVIQVLDSEESSRSTATSGVSHTCAVKLNNTVQEITENCNITKNCNTTGIS